MKAVKGSVLHFTDSRNLLEARLEFTRLLERFASGEEIVITDRSKPVARTVPTERAADAPLRSRAALWASVGRRGRKLSELVIEDRGRR